MTTAAAIIAALLEGKPSLVVERRTGMVHGWGLWMRGLSERLGSIRADAADAVIEAVHHRPVRPPPPAAPALSQWQAFRSLFYQDWDPPLREERGLRWFAGATSVLMHLIFLLLLLYMAMLRLPPPVDSQSDGSRVQVEFVGVETPEDVGGGASEAEAGAAAALQEPAERPSSSEPASSVAALPQQETAAPAPPAAQQPLQVTETEIVTTRFVLPMATARTPDVVPPEIQVPELGIPTRDIRIVEVPPAQQRVPRKVEVPVIEQPQITVRERQIASPLPSIPSVDIPRPRTATAQIRAPLPDVSEAEIAMPSPAPARGQATPTAAQGAGNAPEKAFSPARASQAASGSAPGPASKERAAGSPAAPRGVDWGASTQVVPGDAPVGAGEKPGLFNADGSVRLPGSGIAGSAPAAGPPGSRQAQQADADRASKWLERPEYPYEPTMFDKFWVPNESLLAEWVRRSIKEVEIPIPGTSKKVKCVVSVLALGGSCAVSDPNLNEQPASARPPPEIPVKRTPIPVDS